MCFPQNWITKDYSLYLEKHEILIISDIHFGKFHKNNYKNIYNRIKNLITNLNPKTLVLNGDIWNGYPYNNKSVSIINNLQNFVDNIVLIEGNHEEKCGGFSNEITNSFKTMKYYKIDNILIHHGHHTPPVKADHHIIGHIHPRLNEKSIYLYCDNAYYNSSVTILPAFNLKIKGNDIQEFDYTSHCPIIGDGEDILNYNSKIATSNYK